MSDLPGAGMRVALFATCISDTMTPETPKAVVRVLERLGCTVEFPRSQTCCGQMMTNTGYFDAALGSVRNYVRSFAGYDHIVSGSGSCLASVREQHVMLADRAGDHELAAQAAAVAAKSHEFSEFLLDVLGVTDVGAYFPFRVTYHPTCHGKRFLRLGDRHERLLRAVEGLELVPLPAADQCCGFGGTFSVKNPDVSIAMASDKARHVLETEADYVIAGENACLMNIGGVLHRNRTGVQAIHLAEVLAHTHDTAPVKEAVA
ncbi:MAG: (Fe-S)-binding protein [Propionibacteriaceae bacterium]|nr:(Fe-S)-binding protein [Propionibacteriaceae bacterium]